MSYIHKNGWYYRCRCENMSMRYVFLITLLCNVVSPAEGQVQLFSGISAQPLALNPAFTGMYNGSIRVNGTGRRLADNPIWPGAATGYFSLDARSRDMKNEDYWGVGVDIGYTDLWKTSLKNMNSSLSFAWHKRLATDGTMHTQYGCDIGVGVQVARYVHDFNSRPLYFADNPFPPLSLGTGGQVAHNMFNAGVSFAHILSEKVNYVAGFSVTAINGTSDAVIEKAATDKGLFRSYNTTIGVNIKAMERLSIRPAAYVLVNKSLEMMAGSDVVWRMGRYNTSTHVFAGLWYRSQNVLAVTGGIAKSKVRLSIAIDRGMSFSDGSYPIAGELAFTYIGFGWPGKRRQVICNRF